MLLLPMVAFGKKKAIPAPPLPAAVLNAKSVFLAKGGSSDLAYNVLNSEMKMWAKYKVAGSLDDADLIIELKYSDDLLATDPSSYTNIDAKQTQVVSNELADPQLMLTIYDAKSKAALWWSIDQHRLGKQGANRDKETISAAFRLVGELKSRSR